MLYVIANHDYYGVYLVNSYNSSYKEARLINYLMYDPSRHRRLKNDKPVQTALNLNRVHTIVETALESRVRLQPYYQYDHLVRISLTSSMRSLSGASAHLNMF